MSQDYLKFYDLETYLLGEVGTHFRKTGLIEPVDFFMIFIWKSNRAKTKVRDRLKSRAGAFDKAVAQIAVSLADAKGNKERLRILMQDWGLKLPMASAILTVLYEDEFTVYDVRVCKQLVLEYRPDREFSDELWADYGTYQAAVIKGTPPNVKSLRDRDRFLWGRSLRLDAERDCKA
jgi:hypothetical protein